MSRQNTRSKLWIFLHVLASQNIHLSHQHSGNVVGSIGIRSRFVSSFKLPQKKTGRDSVIEQKILCLSVEKQRHLGLVRSEGRFCWNQLNVSLFHVYLTSIVRKILCVTRYLIGVEMVWIIKHPALVFHSISIHQVTI